MITLSIFVFFCLVILIAFPIGIGQVIYQAVTDKNIKRVVLLDIVKRQASFKVSYDNGKPTKVEVVKFGSPRYNKLRGMCD